MWQPTVLIFVLIAKSCLVGGIIIIPEHDDISLLVRAMVKVTTSCYGNQVNVVGLAGKSDANLIKTLQSSTSISVSLLDGTRRFVSHDPIKREDQYKLQVFIVSTSSLTELKKILTVIKNSIWWNHEASLLISACLPMSENGCSEAYEMLSAAWKMNLLNSKLMCLHPADEILIYTYNPYMSVAPVYWNVENTFSEENTHPWTLFKQRYEEDKRICKGLDFDKTRVLGGYEIRASVKDYIGFISVDVNKSAEQRLRGYHGQACNNLFRAMNVTLKLVVYNRTYSHTYSEEDHRNLMMGVMDGTTDIALNVRYASIKNGTSASYPVFGYGLGILTQHSRPMSQLSKIASIVDSSSRWGIFLVIFITPLSLILFLRQRLDQALMNTLRMICNGALSTLPLNLAPRFYLGGLFVFVVTIQAIYQGKLAALLTKPMFFPNVDTMQDLIDGKFTVYTHKSIGHYFSSREFEGHHVNIETYSCTEYVLHNSSVACVSPYLWQVHDAVTLRLYLSKNPVLSIPAIFPIRVDWPLEQRVNTIQARMFESYICQYEYAKPVRTSLSVRKFNEHRKNDQQYRVITLDELSFAFVILGIGLSCATFYFIVEIGCQLLKVLGAVSLWKL